MYMWLALANMAMIEHVLDVSSEVSVRGGARFPIQAILSKWTSHQLKYYFYYQA